MNRRNFIQVASATALLFPSVGCKSATTEKERRPFADLYNCEGCDGVFERNPRSLSWSTRIGPGLDLGEPLLLDGTVFASDGQTPAPNVIIYAHHTNSAGHYENGTTETTWSERHGRLRGWIRTGADGRFQFHTIKPAPYPTRDNPAHIHLMILEPGRRPYWVDDVVFDGHFGVDADYRNSRENRGGSGIVRLAGDQAAWLAKRNIILEVHPT